MKLNGVILRNSIHEVKILTIWLIGIIQETFDDSEKETNMHVL